jgi:hypothetical protein
MIVGRKSKWQVEKGPKNWCFSQRKFKVLPRSGYVPEPRVVLTLGIFEFPVTNLERVPTM